ncbi:uncharacterized protein DS421_19g656330 [Arachis hypogaea]|uniref:Uncharacterized protein n=1 Tax=Arachis hypogaea TaxID=3818 RepID=A0A6B9V8S8_ARAHY|nr:uncharacterized protein DS421_19g656330 [Arachis hypogaea]
MKFAVPSLLAEKHSLSLCVPPYSPCCALFMFLSTRGAHFNSSLSYSNCSILAGVLLLGFITADHCSAVMKSSSPFNLLRQFLLHRHLPFTLASPQHRAWCTAATPTTNPYHLWKEKEEEILRDIEPVVTLTKDILHSRSILIPKSSNFPKPESINPPP